VALKTSEVFRCLEKKTLVFGFEIVDLFLVFSVLAVLNFVLGSVPYKFFWTWGPSMALGLGLRAGKSGKPDNYLAHLARYHFSPGVFSSFTLATARKNFGQKKGT
jgi:hypothetical protein